MSATVTYANQAEWMAEGVRLFGPDMMAWRFVCPACGHIATVADWKAAGATVGHVGFSCIGRSLTACRDAFAEGPGPCNYAGAGLFVLGPVLIADRPNYRYFDFDRRPAAYPALEVTI